MPISIIKVKPRWIKVKDGDQEAEFLVKPVGWDAHAKAIRTLREVSLCALCASGPPRTVEGEEKKEDCVECALRRWERYVELLSPTVLLDWRGVEDAGKPVPFSLDVAKVGLPWRVWEDLLADAVQEVNEAQARFRGVPATAPVAPDAAPGV